MSEMGQQFPQFYVTAETDCPYLEGKKERKIFTQLTGLDAHTLHENLAKAGFRRSQAVAYHPACENCKACVSVRVVVDDFKLSKSLKRVRKNNSDLKRSIKTATATDEQYDLLSRYLKSRHNDGSMANMTMPDYIGMVEGSPIATYIVEYRTHIDNTLVAVTLTDMMSDGLSMVYSFFDPDEATRGLGNYLILDHIDLTIAKGLSYLYLGYWIKDSKKMSYKSRFQPLERLGTGGWRILDERDAEALANKIHYE